jgi:hypothetical protein
VLLEAGGKPGSGHPGLINHDHVAPGEFEVASIEPTDERVERGRVDSGLGLELARRAGARRAAEDAAAVRFGDLSDRPGGVRLAGPRLRLDEVDAIAGAEHSVDDGLLAGIEADTARPVAERLVRGNRDPGIGPDQLRVLARPLRAEKILRRVAATLERDHVRACQEPVGLGD